MTSAPNPKTLRDVPILFSAPMVRAIMDGSKTQTRRALKPQPSEYTPLVIDITKPHQIDEDDLNGDDQTEEGARLDDWGQTETIWDMSFGMGEPHSEVWIPLKMRWRVGDHLWVREAWRASSAHDNLPPREIPVGDTIEYLAEPERILTGKGRPSIHMPRWASRITLEVTAIRVERLQDISSTDAIAEGIRTLPMQDPQDPSAWWESEPGMHQSRTPTASYAKLWDHINGAGAWDKNPYVSATTFRRVPQP